MRRGKITAVECYCTYRRCINTLMHGILLKDRRSDLILNARSTPSRTKRAKVRPKQQCHSFRRSNWSWSIKVILRAAHQFYKVDKHLQRKHANRKHCNPSKYTRKIASNLSFDEKVKTPIPSLPGNYTGNPKTLMTSQSRCSPFIGSQGPVFSLFALRFIFIPCCVNK